MKPYGWRDAGFPAFNSLRQADVCPSFLAEVQENDRCDQCERVRQHGEGRARIKCWSVTNVLIQIYEYFIGIAMQINLDEVEYITETSLTIRGTRRRTTVPKEIVEHLGFNDGDKIRWILFRDHSVVIVPKKSEVTHETA